MAGEPEIQVSRLLDERGLGPYQIRLMAWSILLSLIDGYDIGAIAFAAPHLVTSWGIDRGALGPVLSANNIGVLFGSALLGWIGDRYGRKPALIGANLLFGVLTVAAAYSADLTQLFWLRLFAGIGIGGVIPNLVAICAESAPRNLRATLPIVAVGCVPMGGALRRCRQHISGSAVRLADPVHDRRHRADRHRARRHFQPAGIDQIHGAARKPATENGEADRGVAPRCRGAGECALRHRGRAADAVVQSGLSVPARAVADHAAARGCCLRST